MVKEQIISEIEMETEIITLGIETMETEMAQDLIKIDKDLTKTINLVEEDL